MNSHKDIKPEVVSFLRKVIYNRRERTAYLLKLRDLANKIIPVISTYSQKSGEIDSIILQERDLRPTFTSLAFRTFPKTFNNDLAQIEKVVRPQDFLIVDLQDYVANPLDEDIIPIIEKLSKFNHCHINILRSAMDHDITNVGLEHGRSVYEADNK